MVSKSATHGAILAHGAATRAFIASSKSNWLGEAVNVTPATAIRVGANFPILRALLPKLGRLAAVRRVGKNHAAIAPFILDVGKSHGMENGRNQHQHTQPPRPALAQRAGAAVVPARCLRSRHGA